MNLFCEGVAMVKLLEGFQAVKRFAHYDIFLQTSAIVVLCFKTMFFYIFRFVMVL